MRDNCPRQSILIVLLLPNMGASDHTFLGVREPRSCFVFDKSLCLISDDSLVVFSLVDHAASEV